MARVLFFINELGDSFYLKKELYFIQAQLCGPAIHGPQGINVLSSKKNYADPCRSLVRPQAQLCGPAVHDPREAGGRLVSSPGSEGGGFHPTSGCVESLPFFPTRFCLLVSLQGWH